MRFSNSNTNPAVPDGIRAGRGLAARFLLSDGTATDLVRVNLPVLFSDDSVVAFRSHAYAVSHERRAEGK